MLTVYIKLMITLVYMQWIVLDTLLTIASSCLSIIISLHYIMLLWKFQRMNALSHWFHIYMYTQNNEFILNALLECIKFQLVHIGNVLLENIHLTYSQLLIITVCLLFCYRNWTCCSQTVCSCDQNHWLHLGFVMSTHSVCSGYSGTCVLWTPKCNNCN